MRIKLYNKNTEDVKVDQIVKSLENGGIIVYPTDSLYAVGCSVKSKKGVEKLKEFTGKTEKEFTLACDSLSTISEYCTVDNKAFKILKRNLPGPFTFILETSAKMPEKGLLGRKTIGVRIQGSSISQAIIEKLGVPLLTSSLKHEEQEYTTDPELIDEMFGSRVDIVVDGGYGALIPTALVDMSKGEVEILREGKIEVII